jgi:HEPN domain-containing protein
MLKFLVDASTGIGLARFLQSQGHDVLFVDQWRPRRRKLPATYIACFHAQQRAEKYMKALLVAQKVPFPKTHDFQILHDLCVAHHIVLAIEPKQLHELSHYAVTVRYPGDDPILEAAKQAVELAKRLRMICRKHLGLR